MSKLYIELRKALQVLRPHKLIMVRTKFDPETITIKVISDEFNFVEPFERTRMISDLVRKHVPQGLLLATAVIYQPWTPREWDQMEAAK